MHLVLKYEVRVSENQMLQINLQSLKKDKAPKDFLNFFSIFPAFLKDTAVC